MCGQTEPLDCALEIREVKKSRIQESQPRGRKAPKGEREREKRLKGVKGILLLKLHRLKLLFFILLAIRSWDVLI